MGETRYYKDKIYIPREIRDKLKLTEGDIIQFIITEEGEIRLIVQSVKKATDRILQRLENPPDLGIMDSTFRRIEIYEDIA